MNRIDLITEQLQIYGQAIQRLGAASLERVMPTRPPSTPKPT
jgi:hypothetical protein